MKLRKDREKALAASKALNLGMRAAMLFTKDITAAEHRRKILEADEPYRVFLFYHQPLWYTLEDTTCIQKLDKALENAENQGLAKGLLHQFEDPIATLKHYLQAEYHPLYQVADRPTVARHMAQAMLELEKRASPLAKVLWPSYSASHTRQLLVERDAAMHDSFKSRLDHQSHFNHPLFEDSEVDSFYYYNERHDLRLHERVTRWGAYDLIGVPYGEEESFDLELKSFQRSLQTLIYDQAEAYAKEVDTTPEELPGYVFAATGVVCDALTELDCYELDGTFDPPPPRLFAFPKPIRIAVEKQKVELAYKESVSTVHVSTTVLTLLPDGILSLPLPRLSVPVEDVEEQL